MEMLNDQTKNIPNADLSVVNVYKPKNPTWKENLSFYFSEYCGATSIHGVQYLGERRRLLIEKIVWAVIITTVWCICIYLITQTYNKWVTSPVIVTFATTETPISDIPFPTVTISPEANADITVFNYTDVLIKKVLGSDVTDEEKQYFDALSLACQGFDLMDDYGIGKTGNVTIELEDLLKILNVVVPVTFVNASYGMWQDQQGSELLTKTISSTGFSFAFNSLSHLEILNVPDDVETHSKAAPKKNWSLDEGYSKKAGRDVFPRRAFVSGMNGGFSFVGATLDGDSKYSCNAPLTGYKVTLHHPSEFPDWDKQIRLPLNQAVLVAIKPRMITISDKLKSYKPEARKCYLGDERKLRFFKSYTQQNCLHECRLNTTLNVCNCLPFYMLGFGGIPICGPGSISCVNKATEQYTLTEGNQKCNCLPSCTSLEYDVEISQTDCDLNLMMSLIAMLEQKNISLDINIRSAHLSLLIVYYKEMQFLTSQRNELYGYVDFFSNTGGLLGLFIGFSVTSFIEILYFLTLRLRCNISIFGKRFWSGSSELIDNYNSAK
ncbi:hypothetical protein ILUMI_05095 [Ignelater luminosus]|uniref:Uncharacterized protein n=1 Tax=Ignelater luminosus TaxID=2038154 RepID=A0A8K0GGP6_IGNLU|nr:hypothetical protein ILUMI_05095 [Ignelater luminosus]